jgi:hypothetical protein
MRARASPMPANEGVHIVVADNLTKPYLPLSFANCGPRLLIKVQHTVSFRGNRPEHRRSFFLFSAGEPA